MAEVSPKTVLRQVFGYKDFRPGQEEIIGTILRGQDVLAIMPTGGGKSLCYQIPALLLPGVTLVVSPLISLMLDQVQALVQLGVRAAYLNSALNPKQLQRALDNACAGVYKLIYVAPERLNTPSIQRLSRSVEISMVCVDEAHCVSQWGQDFRPSYLEIPRFVSRLEKRPVVAAFTATATPRVRRDTQELLELQKPYLALTGFDRPNLYFGVLRPADKEEALLQLLRRRRERCGVIYCATRKETEQLCELLCHQGFSATRYHAGLEPEERRANQEDFLYDRKNIIVATNAFGMGIDKSNVSYVIHYNIPGDLESYYQEAGRAGRDGSPAECILLYSGRDVKLREYLIHLEGENDSLDAATRKLLTARAELRLSQMTSYATAPGCLRRTLLTYFGERPGKDCGNCSWCLAQVRRQAPQRQGFFSRLLGRGNADPALLEALRAERGKLARKYGVTPANVFTDATLRQMAVEKPGTPEELLEVPGVTRVKLRRYGEAMLRVLREEGEKDHALHS